MDQQESGGKATAKMSLCFEKVLLEKLVYKLFDHLIVNFVQVPLQFCLKHVNLFN